MLRIPYFGKVLKKVALARFARTLSTLLLERHPARCRRSTSSSTSSSNMVLDAAPSRTAATASARARASPTPLKKSGLFPPLLVHMIAVGEKSGELEADAGAAADAYDGEVESVGRRRSRSILEPIMIVFMGGVVLFIVLAILLPIFELNRIVH